MAFPTVASVTASTANGTSHPISMPATVNSGDLLVMLFTSDDVATQTTPSGWTVTLASSNGALDRGVIYSKRAVGDEGGTTVDVVTSNIQRGAGQVYRILNAQDIFVSPWVTGSSTTPNPPNLAPGVGTQDFLWMSVMFTDNDSAGTISAYPTNYSDNQTETNSLAASATEPTLGSATRNLAASSENPGTFTISNDAWGAATLAFSPSRSMPPPQPFPMRIWRGRRR